MTSAQLALLGKILQLAAVADLEYEQAKTNGASTLLQPGNFDSILLAITTIFVAPAPSTGTLSGVVGQQSNQALQQAPSGQSSV